jgi:choline dehydrogenase
MKGDLAMSDTFDFIVIGAGSAGCVLAHRLTENGDARVALLEAGGDPDPVLSRIPGAAPRQVDTKADWRFRTVRQKGLYDRVIDYPRGRVLGGSSVLNYMIYVRGNAGDYNGWAQSGNTGWGYDDVLPYFIRAEANSEFDDSFHGTDGPLSVSRNAHPSRPLAGTRPNRTSLPMQRGETGLGSAISWLPRYARSTLGRSTNLDLPRNGLLA